MLTASPLQVTDGPNDQGEMFQRPAKLSDKLPAPYANESVSQEPRSVLLSMQVAPVAERIPLFQAARYANGGAYPPDLSLITKARHNGQNYGASFRTV